MERNLFNQNKEKLARGKVHIIVKTDGKSKIDAEKICIKRDER